MNHRLILNAHFQVIAAALWVAMFVAPAFGDVAKDDPRVEQVKALYTAKDYDALKTLAVPMLDEPFEDRNQRVSVVNYLRILAHKNGDTATLVKATTAWVELVAPEGFAALDADRQYATVPAFRAHWDALVRDGQRQAAVDLGDACVAAAKDNTVLLYLHAYLSRDFGDMAHYAAAKAALLGGADTTDEWAARQVIDLAIRADPDAVIAVTTAALSQSRAANLGSYASGLRAALPADDPAVLAFNSAQEAVVAYKQHLIQSQGRATKEQLDAVVSQLVDGGEARPFRVSAQAVAIADAIDAAGVNKNAWVALTLRGKYPEAMRACWAAMTSASSDKEYTALAYEMSRIIRLADQCYNKRSLDFLKWVNGEIDDNPIAAELAGE